MEIANSVGVINSHGTRILDNLLPYQARDYRREMYTTMKYTKLIDEMREKAFKCDQLGYIARNNGVDYKAREYFAAAIKLREAADSFEYCMS
jgi:hypothetical protein